MGTHEFISDPEGTTSSPVPSPGSSCCSSTCKYPVMCSAMVAVLVSLLITAGLLVCLRPQSPQASKDACAQKISERCPIEEVSDRNGQYKIYKIPRSGAYLIHGEVNMKRRDHDDSVILFGELRGPHDIKYETIPKCMDTLNLVVKTELEENTVLYLKFNLYKPNVSDITFTIYEL